MCRSVMTRVQTKKLRFALSAFGIDPATVTFRAGIGDEVILECVPGTEDRVAAALRLCLPENHAAWKELTFGVRYALDREQLRLLLNRSK